MTTVMAEQAYRVEYRSNNSGGRWWLEDDDWRRLEDAGWRVEWLGLAFCRSEYGAWGSGHRAPDTCPTDIDCPGHRGAESYAEAIAAGLPRFLGSIAREATIEVRAYSATLAEGVAQHWWEGVVGQSGDEQGCNCCGQPHSFWAREQAS